MRSLSLLVNCGYTVQDKKTVNGARIITISGRDAWVRCVFPPGCSLALAKLHVQFLQRSIKNLLQTAR